MNCEITSRHFSPSETLQNLVREKIQKIEKYTFDITSCRVILEIDNGFEKAEIIAHASGQDFFASESSEMFEKSLTAAIDKIIPQIKKHHDKRLGKVKTHQVPESEDSD